MIELFALFLALLLSACTHAESPNFATCSQDRGDCVPTLHEGYHDVDNFVEIEVNDLLVFSHPNLDGGGNIFGLDIPRYLSGHFKSRFKRCVELCAGPGFIGFSLLSLGICQEMVFIDVNPYAIKLLRRTISHNKLEGRTTVYQSDVLKDVPKSELGRWDLVVSNPPHFVDIESFQNKLAHIGVDLDWRLHREFYASVVPFMAPTGHIVMQENMAGSSPPDFLNMLPPELAVVEITTGVGVPDSSFTQVFWNLWTTVDKDFWRRVQNRDVDSCAVQWAQYIVSGEMWGLGIGWEPPGCNDEK